jgi:hypothetical protein
MVHQIVHQRQYIIIGDGFQSVIGQIEGGQSRYTGEDTTFEHRDFVVVQIEFLQVVQTVESTFGYFLRNEMENTHKKLFCQICKYDMMLILFFPSLFQRCRSQINLNFALNYAQWRDWLIYDEERALFSLTSH